MADDHIACGCYEDRQPDRGCLPHEENGVGGQTDIEPGGRVNGFVESCVDEEVVDGELDEPQKQKGVIGDGQGPQQQSGHREHLLVTTEDQIGQDVAKETNDAECACADGVDEELEEVVALQVLKIVNSGCR